MSISRVIFTVTKITLLSRLLSLVSLQVYMSFFGPRNLEINIYSFALNIPNIIFNVIGTIIASVVVPIYAGLLIKDKKASADFINNVITIVCIAVLILIAVGYFGAPLLAGLTDYSYEYYYFLVYALRVMLLVMFFYGLHYVFQGVLQSHNSFVLPAIVTLPTSIIIIIYVFFLGDIFGVTGLIYATVIGLSMQAILLMPAVIKKGLNYKPSLNLNNINVKQALLLSPPVLLSVISFQINTIFNSTLATRFNIVTIMVYVQNLVLVLILSFVYSITGIYLPKLSKIWESKNINEFKIALENVILTIMFFLIPASLGLFFIGFEIINLLAAWGNFDSESASVAAAMFGMYALGAVSIGLKEILDRAFYSQKKTKIPGIVGVLIMAINIIFSITFVNYLGYYTMPISFVISTTIGAFSLILAMQKSIGIISKRLITNILKFFVSGIIMAVFIIISLPWIREIVIGAEFTTRLVRLFIPSLLGVFIYFSCIVLLKIEGIKEISQIVFRRKY